MINNVVKGNEIYSIFEDLYQQIVTMINVDNSSIKSALKNILRTHIRHRHLIEVKDNKIVISRTKNNKTYRQTIPLRQSISDVSNYCTYLYKFKKVKNLYRDLILEDNTIIKQTKNFKVKIIIDINNEVHKCNYTNVQELLNFSKEIKCIYSTEIDYIEDIWKSTKYEIVWYLGIRYFLCIEDNYPFNRGMLFYNYVYFGSLRSPDYIINNINNTSIYNEPHINCDLSLPITELKPKPVSKCIREQYGCSNGCTNSCLSYKFPKVEYNRGYSLYCFLKDLKLKYNL